LNKEAVGINLFTYYKMAEQIVPIVRIFKTLNI